MPDKTTDYPIYSQNDVIDTLRTFKEQHTEAEFDNALDFASELTGMSIDALYCLL